LKREFHLPICPQAEITWNIAGSSITGHLPIIRCVPNIGCAVQSGVTVFTRGKYCNEEDVKPFVTLFSSLGHCEEVEEKHMDGFVALTGSGLAFVSAE
jgi:pyrroline-5-carboxylate reductase